MKERPSAVSALRVPIHVLYMIDELREMGGAERMLLNTIRLLPKDQFRCSLITFKPVRDPSVLQGLPCPYYVFPLRKTYDSNALRTAWTLRNFIRRERVSIVHTFFETSDLWGGLISKIAGAQALVSSRRDMGILRSPKHDFGYRLMNRSFDLVLTVSEEVRKFCIQRDQLAPERVCTLHNGLELDKISSANGTHNLRARLGLGELSPVIITVGHIRRIKGIDVFLKTAARVTREIPGAVFLVVGRNSEPQYFRELESFVAESHLGQNVRFVGESEEVFSFLKMSDVFFLPSRSEGFSNALIEAMACGLPCVATRVGGNGEAIEDASNGYLVDNEDDRAAAERIVHLLRNPDQAEEIGRKARETVKQKFTADVMVSRLRNYYGRLLMKNGNGNGHG